MINSGPRLSPDCGQGMVPMYGLLAVQLVMGFAAMYVPGAVGLIDFLSILRFVVLPQKFPVGLHLNFMQFPLASSQGNPAKC